ncbi:MAG: aldose 1-epimerase family protein [Ruminiclostridium sp.]
MNEKILSKFVGNMQQLAGVRPFTYTEGRAEGLKAYEVKNGLLSFQVMADKCLDISDCTYKGININFLSKPGLMGRNHFDTHGQEALRSIMGGLFFTCGLENICPPCADNDKEYPMHGRIRTTPAEHLSADAFWQADAYHIRISGEMREAELFGENMLLRRSIETIYGEKTIVVRDEIKNCAYRREVLMLLYHFNLGFPLLQENARLILPSKEVIPRDDISNTEWWNVMDAPIDNALEQVFTHKLIGDKEGNTFAALINDALQLGVLLEFNQRFLPNFMEWKSIASGDYVLGLEPANSSVLGRLDQKQKGLHMIAPFDTENIELRITILDGNEDIESVCKRALLYKEKY